MTKVVVVAVESYGVPNDGLGVEGRNFGTLQSPPGQNGGSSRVRFGGNLKGFCICFYLFATLLDPPLEIDLNT